MRSPTSDPRVNRSAGNAADPKSGEDRRGHSCRDHAAIDAQVDAAEARDGRPPRFYTVGDYNDEPARLRALTMPALIVTGAQTVSFHRAMNESLLRTLPLIFPIVLG